MCFFPCLNLITVLHEEVDIVETILQTMLLISVYLEMLTLTGSKVCDRLVRQIDTHLRFVVFIDAVEELFEERLRDDNRQYKVVELVVLVDVSEERTDDHAEAIACDGPGSMLTGGAGTEVLAGHQDDSILEVGVVEHEVLLLRAIGVETPVVKEIRAEAVFLRQFQIAGGDYLVSVHILQRKRDTGGCYDIKFLLHD